MNHLNVEKSPYLQQHKTNPVDWFGWNDAAFEKAQRENKPIFLSIGYSTCHWCHVMARESFENPEVAAALNRDFVSIKVDREERPDVDALYMTALLALTGSGGWPLSAWLTSDGRPFFTGTYFPAPQFLSLSKKIGEVWRADKARLIEDAEKFESALKTNLNPPAENVEPSTALLALLEENFEHRFDEEHGGFKGAPKFPQSMSLMALMRTDLVAGPTRAREFVDRTLEGMTTGGLRDHIEGGFFRYSTRQDWSVPHYEKMLYDQAWIAQALFEGSQFLQNETYAKIGEETLRFVCDQLRHPEGGFYSALDAESVNPSSGKKEEGFYYTQPEETRNTNPKPARDEKIIAAWNGWMISALCTGFETTQNKRWLEAAEAAWNFIHSKMRSENGLARRWCGGDVSIAGTSEDYVSVISAGLALHQVTGLSEYLETAVKLQEHMNKLFWSQDAGGYLFSDGSDRNLMFRFPQDSDGVSPGTNSLAADNLYKLNTLTGSFSGHCVEIFRRQSGRFAHSPVQHPYFAVALANRQAGAKTFTACTKEGCFRK